MSTTAVDPVTQPLPAGPPPLYASWVLRVVATVLDDLLVAGLVFLLLPVPGVGSPGQIGLGPGLVSVTPTWAEPFGTPWPVPMWVGALVVLVPLLMQAYLGSTPGKLVVGIVVVGDRDGRPVGLLRTVARWLSHLVDAVFFIGYLRPLWHREKRTFADSMLQTLVLETRRPRPHRWIAGSTHDDAGPPLVWTSPERPRWHRPVTWVAGAAVLVAAPFGVGAGGTTTPSSSGVCGVTDDADGPHLEQATVSVSAGRAVERRLFVERDVTVGDATRVDVEWSVSELPTGRLDLRLEILAADGATSWGTEWSADDADDVIDAESWYGTTRVDLGPGQTDALGEHWGWRATALVDGVPAGSCEVPAGG